MKESLINAISNLKKIEVLPVELDNDIIGWHSTVILDGTAGGSGAHINKNVATRIAIAETLERQFMFNMPRKYKDHFLMNEYPSTSGFACGFNQKLTRFRSVCEAVERWIWSKWIDCKFPIFQTSINRNNLTSFEKYYLNFFDDYRAYKLRVGVEFPELNIKELEIGIFVGMKDGGVFPGSRVTVSNDFSWTHPLVEAWRHLLIFEKDIYPNKMSVIAKRIEFFGNDGDAAFKQIPNEKDFDWPTPKIILNKEFNTKVENTFLWRTLCDDFIGWHLGSEDRFVY